MAGVDILFKICFVNKKWDWLGNNGKIKSHRNFNPKFFERTCAVVKGFF